MMRQISKSEVLVVDDAPKNIQLMRAILESAGYEVKAATDGPTALQIAQASQPQLILLDVMMPGMDGYAVCSRLKENESTRHIPVIFVTGREDADAEASGFAVGAADYITKPIKVSVVLARVKTQMELDESRQRLRQLAAQNEAAREEERKHIAREVHDELGQILTALRMDLSLLGMRFGSLDPAVNDKVIDMKGLVDRAILGVRNVAVNLHPTALDMGLVPAIEWLTNEFTKHTAIACVFHARKENIDLDETRAVVVFRIVQESLTNVTRYADASLVNITLGHRGNELWVEVRDNGRGFDVDAATKGKSFGLLGMRERALALGGQVRITSSPGQGTAIGLTIPIYLDAATKDDS